MALTIDLHNNIDSDYSSYRVYNLVFKLNAIIIFSDSGELHYGSWSASVLSGTAQH